MKRPTFKNVLRWNQARARAFLLLTILFVVGLSAAGVYLSSQIQTLSDLQDGDSKFAVRPIAQTQREILRYMLAVEQQESAETLPELTLSEQLATSRIRILQRQFGTEQLSETTIAQINELAVRWSTLEPLRAAFAADYDNQELKNQLLSELAALELQANDLLQHYNTWFGVTSTTITRRYQRLFITSQIIGLTFFGLSGLAVYSLFRFAARLQESERTLQVSDARYQLATQAGSVGIWEFDRKDGFVVLDAQLAAMVGLEQTRMTWDGLLQLVQPDDRSILTEQYELIEQGKRNGFEAEVGLQTPLFGLRWFFMRGIIIQRDEMRPMRLTGTLTDVTERKETEMAALEAQRLEGVGVLVGGIAHDFNNLLTGIMSQQSVALLKLKNEPTDFVRKHVQRAQGSAERAAGLTRQLLNYAGKAQRTVETLDLNALIQENRELFDAFIDRKTELTFEWAKRALPVEGDRSQLQQVVMNLVINAAEACTGGFGRVRVETDVLHNGQMHHLVSGRFITSEPGPIPYARMVVTDNGSGMTAETLRKIFDPFFTTKTYGRGLGLSATLGIIKTHRGALHLDTREGEGTTFTVFLPLAEEIDWQSQRPSEIGEIGDMRSVLVIDDEREVRESLVDLLDAMGVRVIAAQNGREGVKCFEQYRQHISLVIVDMQMPLMDGAETIHRLRQLDPAVKVILSSGYADALTGDRPSDAAPNAFLQKPYVIDKFIETVNTVMSSPDL